MTGPISITRQLIVTVLVLELFSAIALIGAITVHERHVQLRAFDASLVANAQTLMGAVQDAEDEGDNVALDLREVQVDRDAIFRVTDEHETVLGFRGVAPHFDTASSGPLAFRDIDMDGRAYRFLVLRGVRIVDANQPNGGVRHNITVVYGDKVGHVWHEVFEAIRFFAIATALLLGLTAGVMIWLVRKGLSPVYEFAREAERISPGDWRFKAPANAKTIQELRPLAEALEAALARLQRSFEQQRRFTNDAAHELKTDVAIVKSSLQLLSMRTRSIEEYSRGLVVSLNDFNRLENTVTKMLTLARLEKPVERDKLDEVRGSCSLRNAVEEAATQVKAFAELKVIDLYLDCMSDARVPIDSRDALLLCSNILLNAVQHGPDGSAVRIDMSFHEESVRLTVSDRGEGISEQDRLHVFEPFYRGDPSRSRKSGGTGLGLSICKAICERAGGTIEIANNGSGGALVTVMLPALAPENGSALSGSLKAQSSD